MLAVAVAAALAGGIQSTAFAAGLGRLTVQSALGQPLQAEVEITSLSREELASLSAKLASPEAFRQAGMEFNPALSSLRFAIDRRPDGRAYVRITSSQPINEPFVDLLVELNWASGRFVREYTFLLDPPDLRIGRETVEGSTVMSQVTPPAAAAAPAARPAPSAPAARPAPSAPVAAAPTTAPAPAPAATVAPSASPAPAAPAAPAAAAPAAPAPASAPGDSAPTSVTVARGENLTEIANRVKPADIAVEQAIIAIYNANPNAFFGNVHQMYAGRTLTIPDRAAMQAVDAVAARRQIRLQAADFNAYRQRLAASTRTVDTSAAGTTAAGSVTAKVDESKAPAPAGDQLVLSRPAGGAAAGAAAGSATGASGGQAPAEAAVAGNAALREQQERVALLEKNVADLQKLLELKNRQLADLQRQVETAQQAPRTATGTVAPAVPATQAAAVATQAPAPSASPTGTGSATPAQPSSVTPAPVPAATPAPAPAAAKPPAAPAPAPSFVDDLLANPYTVPGLAAILVALGAYGWYTLRRRRKSENFEDSLIAADAFTANSLFGTTGGQAVDTSNQSMFGPSMRDTGADVHSTEVDPIAEAEVYIAYGREAQAEEILREAMKRQPDRQAIRTKLLEICAGRKDAAAFGVLAQEMYDMTGGENEEWPKVVTLGLSLDPANPLYAGGAERSAVSDLNAAGPDPAADDTMPAPLGASVDASGEDAGLRAEAAEDLSVGISPLPAASVGPHELPRDFAETQAMQAKPQDGGVPPLDFALSVDTSIGRPADEPDGEGGEGGASELEKAVEGRFELPSLDFAGAKVTAEAPAAEARSRQASPEEPPAFADLGDFRIDLPALEDLDLKGGKPALAAGADEGALELAALEVMPAEGGTAQWQEMATKLDLASAYEEIGDKDGARELLEEVVRGGDAEQKRKAQTMLSKIG